MKTRRQSKRQKRRREAGARALDLIGEAIHLVRAAPLGLVAAYYVGAAPCMLGFLFFWSDMSRSGFAHQRCFAAALGMTALFLWMKSWQAVFAAGLKARVAGTGPDGAAWRGRRIARMVTRQAVLQPYGLLAIPTALFLALPFYAVHAFYQNVTVLGDGSSANSRELARRALRQAVLWPKQNHVLIWLLSPWVLGAGLLVAFGSARMVVSLVPELHHIQGIIWFLAAMLLIFHVVLPLAPFGCVVAANVAAFVAVAPQMLHSLLGIETTFTLSGWHAVFNTTFLMTVFTISYLCLDPIVKAVHVLRCFYGESWHTGEDLIVELQHARQEADRTP